MVQNLHLPQKFHMHRAKNFFRNQEPFKECLAFISDSFGKQNLNFQLQMHKIA